MNDPRSPDATSSRRAQALRDEGETWQKTLEQHLAAAEQAQDWSKVESLCKQILQRDGENWPIWQRLALSLEAREDWTQAETLWRHLTQRFSQKPEPYLALASLQRKRGAPDAARVVLEQAEQRLGPSAELTASLGVIDDPWADHNAVLELTAGSPASAVAMALQRAQAHLEAGRLAEAEASFEQLLIAKPQSISIHRTLAQLRLRRGEPAMVAAQLSALYQPCPSLGPLVQQVELPLLFADALTQLERWDELKTLLRALAALHPQDARLAYGLAQAALAEDNDLEALPLLQRSLSLEPSFARAELALGELNMRLGDWQAAIDALTRAVALDPRLEQAASALEQARCEQLWQKGELALSQADWSLARDAFRRLLDRAPKHPRALQRLELLASLEPHNLAGPRTTETAGLQGAELRVAEFQIALDRFEHQLNRFDSSSAL